MKPEVKITAEILAIVNNPGITWKVRRALLREKGVSETLVLKLIPEPKGKFHPSDY